jgi:hypothetical protein
MKIKYLATPLDIIRVFISVNLLGVLKVRVLRGAVRQICDKTPLEHPAGGVDLSKIRGYSLSKPLNLLRGGLNNTDNYKKEWV